MAVSNHFKKLGIRHIAAYRDGIPVLLVHVVSGGNVLIYPSQEVGFHRVAFEIDTQLAVAAT